ncbi:Gamma-glutamylcyclotransferase, partial [Stegodyphus mimosarum]
MMTFSYFAFGSNMLTKRMHINCPSARYKYIAKLKDFKFAFVGYADAWKGATATVIPSPSDSVWGVVWEISKQQEPLLDQQESGYKGVAVTVETNEGDPVVCKLYQKPDPKANKDYNKPSTIYKAVILQGAKE